MTDVDDDITVALTGMGLGAVLPADFPRTERSAAEAATIVERRRGVRALGKAVRALADSVAATECGSDELYRRAQEIDAITAGLSSETRRLGAAASVDDPITGVRMYVPFLGPGSPLIAPLDVSMREGVAEATVTLGAAYEGPPAHAHGGVSAMLLDHALGFVVASLGAPGVTRQLTVRYRRPVPLHAPLLVRARITDLPATGGMLAFAAISAASDPDVHLVEADGDFREISPELAVAVLRSYEPS